MTLQRHHFDRFEKRFDQYVSAAMAGQKNPRLCAILFNEGDALSRGIEEDSQLLASVRCVMEAAEQVIRLAHVRGHAGFEAAKQRYNAAASELRRRFITREKEAAAVAAAGDAP